MVAASFTLSKLLQYLKEVSWKLNCVKSPYKSSYQDAVEIRLTCLYNHNLYNNSVFTCFELYKK